MKRARLSWLPRVLAAAAGLAFGLAAAELSFGRLRPETPGPAPVLYSVEVRDGRGALLFSPLLVGEEGQRVHLSLRAGPHSDPREDMSLDLDPRSEGGENLCLGYRLSLDGGVSHQGRIGVSYGEPRAVRLEGGPKPLHVEFVVARARTGAFHRLLRSRRRPAA